MRKKIEKAVVAKEKQKAKALIKESPEISIERDSFDEALNDPNNRSLSEKLGMSPKLKGPKGKKANKKDDGLKQTKLNFGSKKTSDKVQDDDIDEFDLALEDAIPLRYLNLFFQSGL